MVEFILILALILETFALVFFFYHLCRIDSAVRALSSRTVQEFIEIYERNIQHLQWHQQMLPFAKELEVDEAQD